MGLRADRMGLLFLIGLRVRRIGLLTGLRDRRIGLRFDSRIGLRDTLLTGDRLLKDLSAELEDSETELLLRTGSDDAAVSWQI